jgi:hypothetical protein
MSEDRWIKTEAIYPPLWIVLVSAAVVMLVVFSLTIYWFAAPLFGVPFTVVYTSLFVAAVVTFNVMFLRSMRGSSVRVSALGIERKAPRGPIRLTPPSDVRLEPRSRGFGALLIVPPQGYAYLSPNQFAAAKARFPVKSTGSSPADPPIR